METITSMSGLMGVVDDFIAAAPKLIQFCLHTFPLNIGVVLGIVGMITAFVRKLKPIGRT